MHHALDQEVEGSNIDSDHLCYIYFASFTSTERLIPGESILSSISITVQACAKDLCKYVTYSRQFSFVLVLS